MDDAAHQTDIETGGHADRTETQSPHNGADATQVPERLSRFLAMLDEDRARTDEAGR